jgi:hypothetical protein
MQRYLSGGEEDQKARAPRTRMTHSRVATFFLLRKFLLALALLKTGLIMVKK